MMAPHLASGNCRAPFFSARAVTTAIRHGARSTKAPLRPVNPPTRPTKPSTPTSPQLDTGSEDLKALEENHRLRTDVPASLTARREIVDHVVGKRVKPQLDKTRDVRLVGQTSFIPSRVSTSWNMATGCALPASITGFRSSLMNWTSERAAAAPA